MIKIDCYIQNPSIDSWFMNPELKFIHIDDEEAIKTNILSRKKFNAEYFNAEYIDMIITISDDQAVIALDGRSGLNIWCDYLNAIEELLQKRVAKKLYGIDPVMLEMIFIDEERIKLCIFDELEPDDVYAEGEFPARLFLLALLDEIERFVHKLLGYGDFEDTIYMDYFAYHLDKIRGLKTQVNQLL